MMSWLKLRNFPFAILCFCSIHLESSARAAPADHDVHYHPQSSTQRTDKPNIENQALPDWEQKGQEDLMASLKVWPQWSSAKNVIIFIGDGMGVSTQTAARFLKAQNQKTDIWDTKLSWEQFPVSGLAKTYNTDQQSPDSAGTANAFLSGHKTRAGIVGVNQNVPRGNCSMVDGNHVTSLLHYGMNEGKRAGIVTTTRITHATPACAYAHSADRNWEDDADIPVDAYKEGETCRDIAWQLVNGENNHDIRVILGGGRRHFLPNTTADPEYPEEYGHREDELNLIDEWLLIHKNKGLTESQYKYVANLTDFNNVNSAQTEYLLGLFEYSHMQFEADRPTDPWGEPSLSQMVSKTIDILNKGSEGFVLLVEGGRIDHAHHDNNAYRSLHDTLALDQAVQTAMDKTNTEDTLIILTADHSHVFTISGYQALDNDIFGITVIESGEVQLADDDKPWTTLGYTNGPGFYAHRSSDGSAENDTSRMDLSFTVTNGTDFLQDSAVPLDSETHGGEDVAVFARGPMSHLLAGIHEQSYIAHAAGYAACIGWNKELCQGQTAPPSCDPQPSGANQVVGHVHVILMLAIIVTNILH